MLREFIDVRQIPGDPKRRWFDSANFDLIVWYGDDGSFVGFELCYNKQRNEHSILWRENGGFEHTVVDDGELNGMKHKASPMSFLDGHFDARSVHSDFLEASSLLPYEIAVYVLRTLERHQNFSPTR